MKIKSFLTMAAAALMLASCHNSADNATATPDQSAKADSLMYYFGQLRGAEFKKAALNDTTLDDAAAKQEFIRGVQAGLNAVKADKEAYNQGLFLGMQMAMNMAQFKETYDVSLDSKSFMKGLREVVTSDSTVDEGKMQQEFYRIMGEFNTAKETRDKESASKALSEAASKQGMSKIADNLYGKASQGGEGRIKEGDKVKLDMKLATVAGRDINAPLPSQITVGERMQDSPLTAAILSLKSGETGKFLTSANALFGQRAQQLELKPDDVISIEITPTVEEPSKEE